MAHAVRTVSVGWLHFKVFAARCKVKVERFTAMCPFRVEFSFERTTMVRYSDTNHSDRIATDLLAAVYKGTPRSYEPVEPNDRLIVLCHAA